MNQQQFEAALKDMAMSDKERVEKALKESKTFIDSESNLFELTFEQFKAMHSFDYKRVKE